MSASLTPDDRRAFDRRRPGRPALVPGERSTSLRVAVSLTMFDAVDGIARRTGESLPEVVRRALARLLNDERGGAMRL